MSILIVDDSVVICKALTILLRKAGYKELVSLSSAAEARSYLEAQKEGEVELVLLDFQMPDETGLELLTQLKRDTRFRDIPFIMITAEKEETILEQAFSAGATDYISKPLRPIELAARVRSALNLSAEMNRRRTREKELVEITTQLKDANRKLEAISRLDGLTGVANRRMFDEKLQKEWRRCARSGRPLSIIMIDIDHFKGFNDYYGHLEGDESLRSVANAVRNSIRRPSDLAARYGGEEFVVLLPETDLSGATVTASSIRDAIVELARPSSRQESPGATGRSLFSPFAACFRGGATISRPYSS